MLKRSDEVSIKALEDGDDPVTAYIKGHPLAGKWHKETVARRALELFTPENIQLWKDQPDLDTPRIRHTPNINNPDNFLPITQRQEQFCQEYLVDLNGTAAAIRAGYSKKSPHVQASKLLAQPRIQFRLAQLKKNQFERIGVGADDLLTELVKMAFRDVRQMFNADGDLLMPDQMDDFIAAAIDSIEVVARPKPGADGVMEVDHVHKIKLTPKAAAMDMLGRHFGLFKERLEVTGKNGAPIETITSDMTPEKAAEIYMQSLREVESA